MIAGLASVRYLSSMSLALAMLAAVYGALMAVPAVAAVELDADAKTMTKLTIKIVNPATPIRKGIWRYGKGLLRLEQRTAGQNRLGWISIVNSPDTWEIDPVKKIGSHIIDDRPPTIATMAVFPGEDDLAQLEVGHELEFFKSHQATVAKFTEPGQGVLERYQVQVAGKELTLDCRAGDDRPLRVICSQCTKVKEIEYTQYERIPVDASIFKPDESIAFMTATYAKGALGKPIATQNPAVTLTVTLAPIVIGTTSMQAWFYQSHGLTAVGQPEILVVLLKRTRESDYAYPSDPIDLINSLAVAKSSSAPTLHAGMYAHILGLFGGNFAAVVFAQAPSIAGVTVPKGTLVAMPITEAEHKVCQIAGSSRMFAQLAFENNYLPCPFWCKRNRKTVFTEAQVDQMKNDPFTSGSPSFVSDASALMRLKICTLSITPEAGAKLADALKKTKSRQACLRVQLQHDPRAARIPLWHPEKKAPHEYLIRGSITDDSVSPSFLLIASDQLEDRLDIVQDGLALFLTNASYEKLIKSLTDEPIPIPLAAGDAVQFSTMWNINAARQTATGTK